MRLRASVLALGVSVGVLLALALPGSSAGLASHEWHAQAETIPGTCQSNGPGGEVAVTFTDQGGPKRVHLLLDHTVVRPGEQLRLAPRNLSRRPVNYGLETAGEEAGTGRPLRGTGFAFFLIGLTAEPGEVGPCATLDVPNTAPLGDYLAVLKGVDGAGLSDEDLKAPFTIAGEPLDAGPFVTAGARSIGPNVHGTFSERELNRAADRLAKILRTEPASGWGIGHRNNRRLHLEITELTVKGLAGLARVADVPVRVRVASGP